MTRKSIEEQVEVLRTTTERVGVSRETAADFLRSAGIAPHINGDGRKQVDYAGKDGRWIDREAASGKFVAKK